jgi:hypothetical protein
VNPFACHESSGSLQPSLPVGQPASPADRWGQLPEEARGQVLVLLARLIARGIVAGSAGGDPRAEVGCD